jgi:hypothetical protein
MTFTLELSDGRREYISAASMSQARFRADGIAAKIDKSITFKLREATEEEKQILLRAHTYDGSELAKE